MPTQSLTLISMRISVSTTNVNWSFLLRLSCERGEWRSICQRFEGNLKKNEEVHSYLAVENYALLKRNYDLTGM